MENEYSRISYAIIILLVLKYFNAINLTLSNLTAFVAGMLIGEILICSFKFIFNKIQYK